jgi:hypothetical protein
MYYKIKGIWRTSKGLTIYLITPSDIYGSIAPEDFVVTD